MSKTIVFKDEPKREVFDFFEEVLVEDKYGLIYEVLLSEKKRKMEFYHSPEEKVLDVLFEGDYTWISLMVYVQSICDYYDRNICEPKFTVAFDRGVV